MDSGEAFSPLPSVMTDLVRVRKPGHGGVQASAGKNFRDAFFARDAAEVAEDLIDFRPDISADVIRGVVVEMGTHRAPAGVMSTEEERGRVHHESRRLFIDGHRIDAGSARLLERLAARWGGTSERMTYYGSVDSTPLFVRLVSRHVSLHGPSILDEVITNKDGETVTVGQAVVRAVEWIDGRIAASSVGLLEFCRINPDGIEYQNWKDGKVSAMHIDASPADFRQPIAATEVQGLAYDALVGAAAMLAHHPGAAGWARRAVDLREAALTRLWMPDAGYFAMGLDRDAQGQPRQIRTTASNGAELLDTGLFDGLDQRDRQRYVGGIVRTVISPEFVTDAGIRLTGLRHRNLTNYWQYQGTHTSWFKATSDVARGLRRQGFGRTAEQLENRMLNAANVAGNNSEYVYVDDRGQQLLESGVDAGTGRQATATIVGTNSPDRCQAWTVSALYAIKHRRGHRPPAPPAPPAWVQLLEADLLAALPTVVPQRWRTEIEALRQACPAVRINHRLGRAREAAFVARQRAAMPALGRDGGPVLSI